MIRAPKKMIGTRAPRTKTKDEPLKPEVWEKPSKSGPNTKRVPSPENCRIFSKTAQIFSKITRPSGVRSMSSAKSTLHAMPVNITFQRIIFLSLENMVAIANNTTVPTRPLSRDSCMFSLQSSFDSGNAKPQVQKNYSPDKMLRAARYIRYYLTLICLRKPCHFL